MMPYRFIPMLLFAILSTYVGQDFARELFANPADRGRIVGVPRVVDGDTVAIEGTRLRLHGIDAPEMGQPAITPDGQRVDAGHISRAALAEIVGASKVECNWSEIDRFQRPIAICTMPDGRDINGAMVNIGAAFAYWEGRFPTMMPTSIEYAFREFMARIRGDGFHSYEIVSPAAYRAAQRQRNGDQS